ncbi:TRAP transporter small permease [Actinocorallia aurantiaca]|uniref:Tripartite ATP-independent periplasmic transporters DctQ component domain-containing protein n=1 Tax=Actinocorallia aurantiaca TaxID=46204 RepID=A0ABN3UPY0_9ACTN
MNDRRETTGRTGSVFATAVIVGLVIIVVLNAVTREFFGSPIIQALPLVQYWFMPAIVFLGYVLAQTKERHLQVDLLFARLRPGGQRVLRLLSMLLSGVGSLLIAYHAWHYAREAQLTDKGDAVSGVAIWPVTYLAPLAMAALGILFLRSAVRTLRTGSAEGLSPSPVKDAV